MDCRGHFAPSARTPPPKVLFGSEERPLSARWPTATGAELPRMLESRHSKSDIKNTQSFAFEEAQRRAERRLQTTCNAKQPCSTGVPSSDLLEEWVLLRECSLYETAFRDCFQERVPNEKRAPVTESSSLE